MTCACLGTVRNVTLRTYYYYTYERLFIVKQRLMTSVESQDFFRSYPTTVGNKKAGWHLVLPFQTHTTLQNEEIETLAKTEVIPIAHHTGIISTKRYTNLVRERLNVEGKRKSEAQVAVRTV